MKWILAPSVVIYFSLQIKVQKVLIQNRFLACRQVLHLQCILNNIEDLQPLISDYQQGRQYNTNVMTDIFDF